MIYETQKSRLVELLEKPRSMILTSAWLLVRALFYFNSWNKETAQAITCDRELWFLSPSSQLKGKDLGTSSFTEPLYLILKYVPWIFLQL